MQSVLDISAWRESWNKLRSECETQSFAHPQVALCRWRDSEFSVCQMEWRMDKELRLAERWERLSLGGKSRSRVTRVLRSDVMGIVNRTMNGDGVMYWLMHERVARAAQRQAFDAKEVAAEFDRAHDVELIFHSLSARGGNLLRQVPAGAGFRLADGLSTTGPRLWVDILFAEALHLWDKSVRLTHWLPAYIPMNCQWRDFEPRKLEVLDSPFAVSVSLIEALTKGAAESIPPEFRTRLLQKQEAAKYLGISLKILRDRIDKKLIRYERQNRQSGFYDLRDFPQSVHGRLSPEKTHAIS
jgi:hypothetical protein